MFLFRVRPALCAALALLALDWSSVSAQLTTGYRPIAEPGIYGQYQLRWAGNPCEVLDRHRGGLHRWKT